MNDNTDEFLAKLKKMSPEELNKYASSARFIDRCIMVLGVSCLLFALYFPSLITTLAVTVAVVILGTMASALGEFRKSLRQFLLSKDK